MCTEVEQSLSKFEAYLDAKGQTTTTATNTTPGVVRTYDIDAPTDGNGNGNGKGSSAAGLALSTKKQI